MSIEIELVQAEEKEILRNMYQFYLHDLSEFSHFLKVGEICELFILKGFRQKGIGQAVVSRIFTMFPGKYVIAQLAENKPAVRFWYSLYRKLSIKYTESQSVSDGDQIIKQRFEFIPE